MLEKEIKKIMETKDVAELKKLARQIQEEKDLLLKAVDRRLASLDEKSAYFKAEKYIRGLETFKKAPSSLLAKKLLTQLKELDFMTIEEKTKREFTTKKLDEMQFPLFMYFLEQRDIKSIEKFLLSRCGKTEEDAEDCDYTIIRKYKKHLKQDGLCHSEYSKHIYAVDRYLLHELYKFMELLGELDCEQRPDGCGEIYRSQRFKKYLFRATCDVYGDPYAFVYADGEFGHEDHKLSEFMEAHDEAYQEKLKSLEAQEQK